ncbi:MAG: hypothetical protein ACRC6L_13055 [Steroidobacteraceae bacterium]
MAERRPLVIINGIVQELPAGDSVPAPASALPLKTAEVDFGAVSSVSKVFTVADPEAVAGTHAVVVQQAGRPPVGLDSDESEFTAVHFRADVLADGQITVYADSLTGPVLGPVRLYYFLQTLPG